MTNELIERLRGLLEKATPELLAVQPHRLAQMLRDGAHSQVPKPDNVHTHDYQADAVFIAETLRALPALLDALTAQRDLLLKCRERFAEEARQQAEQAEAAYAKRPVEHKARQVKATRNREMVELIDKVLAGMVG
jgi:hypothetical protein